MRVHVSSIAFAAVLAVSSVAWGPSLTAQIFDGPGLEGGLTEARQEIGNTGIRDDDNLFMTIAELINFVLPYAGLATVVAFVISGFTFILGFGNDSANQRARKIMTWSAIGLVFILFSFALTNFIIRFGTQ